MTLEFASAKKKSWMIKLEKFGSCMHARTAIDRQTDGTIRTVEDLYDLSTQTS